MFLALDEFRGVGGDQVRGLLIPQIVSSGGAAEGNYYSMKCIMRALQAIEPSFFYVWLSRAELGRFEDRPGVMHLFEDRLRLGFTPQMAGLDMGRLINLFSWQVGQYPIDAVFCSRAGVAPLLQIALSDVGAKWPVPVILTEPRVYGPGEHGHNQGNTTELALRAAGYASCFGLYWSKWEREGALAAASVYCSAATLKAAEERAFVVDALVDVSNLAKEVTRPAWPKRLLFAGRLNANKRYEEILQAFGKVLMTRKDIEVWVHGGTGAFVKLDAAQHKWHFTSERLSQVDYWGLLGTSHVGAYMSHDEGANITTQEMLASGVVLALPKREWVRKLFHPLEYPFQVDGFQELPAMVDWLIDHYDEAHAQLAPIRAMIEAERSWPAFVTKFGRLWEAVRAVEQPPPFRVFRKMARSLGSVGASISFQSAIALEPRWSNGAMPPEYTADRGMKACYNAVRTWDDHTMAMPSLIVPEETDAEKV